MSAQHQVRLYRDGGEQAVHIPREFELPGEKAVMRREGNRLVIESHASEEEQIAASRARNAALLAMLATLQPLGAEDDFPEITDGPSRPVNL